MKMQAKSRRGQRGLALVELALATPLLMLLLVGIIEVGRFAYFSILVGNAAQAGAQYGAGSLTNALDVAGMQSAALNDGQNVPGLTVASPAPSSFCQCYNGTTTTTIACSQTSCPLAGYHRNVYVQVTTRGSFTPLFNYPGLPGSLTVTRTVTMRVTPQ
jgi:Flp pilus assembly protein TadG